ncbi:hypothetical protein NNO_0827 [Hydrogenimonas sp.]|nr:hypothetical protein NNO_0827 [Hydrogenimonas sp.]
MAHPSGTSTVFPEVHGCNSRDEFFHLYFGILVLLYFLLL